MDDDIDLPPLLPNGKAFLDWFDDARRAAVLADRERRAFVDKERVAELEDEARDLTGELTRERRAKVDAKPVVHSTTLRLCPDGYAWRGTDAEAAAPGYGVLVDLRWTDDGRAWIESEQNRSLARFLRADFDAEEAREAAAALDGGER